MVGGDVDSIVVVDGRRVNRLDSAVLNNIPVRGVDKGRCFFSNARQIYHKHVGMYTQHFLTTYCDGWTVGIFTQIGDMLLYKIVDTSNIYR